VGSRSRNGASKAIVSQSRLVADFLLFSSQVMLEILIEELHNHLYLKSFYCDVRWKSYTRGQTTRQFNLSSASFEHRTESILNRQFPSSTLVTTPTSLHRFLPIFPPLSTVPVDQPLDYLECRNSNDSYNPSLSSLPQTRC